MAIISLLLVVRVPEELWHAHGVIKLDAGAHKFTKCFFIGDFSGRFVLFEPHIDALLRALGATTVVPLAIKDTFKHGPPDLVPTDELHGLAAWGVASLPGFEHQPTRGASPACQ